MTPASATIDATTPTPTHGYGAAMPSTSEVLLERLRSGSKPGERNDDHVVALVVEGGGMRGTVSAGMLIALDQLGFRDTFDMVVGTSAGALEGAFFITGMASSAASMYYDELSQEPFLSKKRLMRLGPALDVHYLIYEASPRRGLSFHQVSNSPIPLYATLTPVDADNETKLVHAGGGAERTAAILQATVSLPVLGGDSKEVDERYYVDGGLTEQIPWHSAATLGATHMLIAPSKFVSGTEERASQGALSVMALAPLIRSMHGAHVAEIVKSLTDRSTYEMWCLREIIDGNATPLTRDGSVWKGHAELIELASDTELPDRLESERGKLVDAVMAGSAAVLSHFGLDTVSVEQQVVLTHPDVPGLEFRRDGLADVVLRDAALKASQDETATS